MRISRVSLIATITMALGTITYLALSVNNPVEPIPVQPVSEDREAPATSPLVTLEQAEEISDLLATEDTEDTEIVFGISVKKDRTCTLVERYLEQDDGSLMRGVECIPAETLPGPYELLTNETLMEMTYKEAGAAAELAKRWAYDYPKEARMLALRAVALDSSNVKPIETLAWDQYSQDYDQDGIATEFVQETYVLLRTAEVIKGGYLLDVDHSRDLLLKAGYTDEQMAGLEQRVDMEVGFIQKTQVEMTGATTIARTEQ